MRSKKSIRAMAPYIAPVALLFVVFMFCFYIIFNTISTSKYYGDFQLYEFDEEIIDLIEDAFQFKFPGDMKFTEAYYHSASSSSDLKFTLIAE